jgi:hypothetical protein
VQEGIRYSFLENRSKPADRRNIQSAIVTDWPAAPHQDFDVRTFDQLQEKSSATQKRESKSGCVPEGQDDGSLARGAWNREVVSPSRRARYEGGSYRIEACLMSVRTLVAALG